MSRLSSSLALASVAFAKLVFCGPAYGDFFAVQSGQMLVTAQAPYNGTEVDFRASLNPIGGLFQAEILGTGGVSGFRTCIPPSPCNPFNLTFGTYDSGGYVRIGMYEAFFTPGPNPEAGVFIHPRTDDYQLPLTFSDVGAFFVSMPFFTGGSGFIQSASGAVAVADLYGQGTVTAYFERLSRPFLPDLFVGKSAVYAFGVGSTEAEFVPVPEPASLMLVAGGLAMALRRWRHARSM